MAREMSMIELESEVEIMLKALKIEARREYLIKDVSVQFICEYFGVIISAINRVDYSYVSKIVVGKFPDYRCIYISTFDNLLEVKDDVTWTLMRGGYMKFIRINFPRQFNELITMQSFGNKIINERLKRWSNMPKYKFFIEENKEAKLLPATMVLAAEPSFFDYMPR